MKLNFGGKNSLKYPTGKKVMGIVTLWSLLEPIRQTKRLSELKGQKLAIDLSTWILACNKVTSVAKYKNVFLRSIYFRCLDVLKCGTLPVFVCDGSIPKIKFDTIQHRRNVQAFQESKPIFRERSKTDSTQICRGLFECLGLPCLVSEGEAEAFCAFLNQQNIVDGCLSADSDLLLYGAKTIYRNYIKKNKVCYVDCYEWQDLKDQMNLSQRDLISIGLLLGCDFNQNGVSGVGIKTALRLIREMKQNQFEPLQRMMSWRNDEELQELDEKMVRMKERKHCDECLHIVEAHRNAGCDFCRKDVHLSEDLGNCKCSCHSILQKIECHEEELKVRQKALLDPDFPSQLVIEEFLIPTKSQETNPEVNWKEPSISALQTFVSKHLNWNGETFIKTLIPVLIEWKINSSAFQCLEGLEPIRILKKHRQNYQNVYQVEWSKSHCDLWTQETTYKWSVEIKRFGKRFPQMAKLYEESLIPEKTLEQNPRVSLRRTRSFFKNQGSASFGAQDFNEDTRKEKQLCLRRSKRLIEINKNQISPSLKKLRK